MVETKREIERKYESPTDGAALPDLTRVPGVSSVLDRGVVDLDAVYYDTPDGRLAADKITLRRRTGGSDAGWHLKLPVSPAKGIRDEIHAPLQHGPREDRTPPADLTALVRSRTRDVPLIPVIRLRSARHLRHLVDAAGEQLAEVSVDRVHAERLGGPDDSGGSGGSGGDTEAAGGPGRTAEWTETEVELADDGPPELLDRVEDQLREAGWDPSRAGSKLARALEETAPETHAAADPTHRPGRQSDVTADPAPDGPAIDHLLAYLRAQRDALVDMDPAVRRELPDAVHRMRVATRRSRSVLRTYRNVLERTVTDPLGADLKWLAAELGADRDREVLTARLTAALDDLPPELRAGPVGTRLHSWSEGRRGDARRRVTEVLDGERYLTLLAGLDSLIDTPPLCAAAHEPADVVLGKAVRRDRRRLRRRLDKALGRPPGGARDVALHEARKAAKRLRYAAEAATPALGARARQEVSGAKRLQSLLGDHQDSVMARHALRDLATQAHAAGETTFTYGLLYGREEAGAARKEKDLSVLWESQHDRTGGRSL